MKGIGRERVADAPQGVARPTANGPPMDRALARRRSGGPLRRTTFVVSSVGGTSGGGGCRGGTSMASASRWNPSPRSSHTLDITTSLSSLSSPTWTP
jgi:hypothetical protein